ncbi:MAG: hypothetical protein J3R72DRAFT_448410 [Linnemannia gamsii]|nr:MAG: hypothetical protein J3R72DRAFT_448410 [Linnemannia gamsii]
MRVEEHIYSPGDDHCLPTVFVARLVEGCHVLMGKKRRKHASQLEGGRLSPSKSYSFYPRKLQESPRHCLPVHHNSNIRLRPNSAASKILACSVHLFLLASIFFVCPTVLFLNALLLSTEPTHTHTPSLSSFSPSHRVHGNSVACLFNCPVRMQRSHVLFVPSLITQAETNRV